MIGPDGAFDLGVTALAAWRLAVLLVVERGPWKLVTRLRSLAGVDHDEDGDATSLPDSMPGSLFGCVWCMSLWTAGAMYGILLVRPEVVVGIAVWGLATAIDGLVRGGHR